MKTDIVNISFNKGLLKAIDRTARREFRSRSELIREAARRYIGSRKRWKTLLSIARRQAKRMNLKERDVTSAIESYRRGNKPSS